MIDVLITLVSSPRGFTILIALRSLLSCGSFILSKYLGDTNEYVAISYPPRATAAFLRVRINFCSSVNSALATPRKSVEGMLL